MITYIYFVKCPDCEAEHFDFFDEAKEFALGCLSQKPIITQTEVNRNDFGECTDHCDLGTVWSWEDVVGKETDAEPATFSKDVLKVDYDPDNDPEFDDNDFFTVSSDLYEDFDVVFDNAKDSTEFFRLCREIGIKTSEDLKAFMDEVEADRTDVLDKLRAYRAELGDDFEITECTRKPIPEGMTIEQLVEEMEENEDTVECTWCEELFDKSECRYEVDLGWLCCRCEAAIKSRGETLTFRENNYWDFLDEAVDDESVENTSRTWMCYFNGKDLGTVEAKDESEAYHKMEKTWPEYNYNNEDVQVIPVDELEEELEWHTYKITFTTKANPDKEQTTTFKTWQSDVEYAWRMSNANIPHTTVKNIELVEGVQTDTMSMEELVTDSINHLINDLGKDPAADDFADEVIGDIERNCNVDISDEPVRYRDWCSAVACEVSRQLNNKSEFKSFLEELEEPDTYRSRLGFCPECGGDHAFDTETNFCMNCGFMS